MPAAGQPAMTMKPGGEAERRAAASEQDGGEALGSGGENPTKGGRKVNGSEHGKATKGVRATWSRAAVPGGESGGPGEGNAAVPGLEALHWGKVRKQQQQQLQLMQQQQQPPSSQQQQPPLQQGPSQSARLKQIVLLQLDLIEQQQQQLQLKEREIDELKAEKETVRKLKWRSRIKE